MIRRCTMHLDSITAGLAMSVMMRVLVHCNTLIDGQVLEQLVTCRFLTQDFHVVVVCAAVMLVLRQVLTMVDG